MKQFFTQHIEKFITSVLTLALTLMPKTAHAVVLEEVFRKYRIDGRSEYNELNNVANLPDPDVTDLILQIIFIILRVSSILAFLALTISGIMFIISRGEGDTNMLEKAKKTIIFTVIGIVIIMMAYAIVFGITGITYDKT